MLGELGDEDCSSAMQNDLRWQFICRYFFRSIVEWTGASDFSVR